MTRTHGILYFLTTKHDKIRCNKAKTIILKLDTATQQEEESQEQKQESETHSFSYSQVPKVFICVGVCVHTCVHSHKTPGPELCRPYA